jgi:hypothetical protein
MLNFYLASGGIKHLIVDERDKGNTLLYGAVILPAFTLTECLPALAFGVST